MEYYEQLLNARRVLPVWEADERLEKLEKVLTAAMNFIQDIEEFLPGACIEVCPALVTAVREANREETLA